ncbi:hypothetical protein GYMLUDRAFT_231859 [Collybiopsis luxurians FD-317 M1]|uniref:Uncharacterized protein n=1 Tax=Collybiopsis luxurians FD-317 M1 TaxID=944289 RepID=A0A0D0C9L8_9AGAR|nr:hypothetical protein GYMLUDRAFT_231859 [Collybiopsis luxurians FD-317 M1]
MSSFEVIEALGPGNQLSNLNKFAASYKAANSNFIDLLTYPFLQSMVLGESEGGNQDLRTIVVDGNSRFGQLCITNISIAQQVISYARTVPVLLPNMTIGGYATTIKPLVAQYIAQALASANGNEQFFENVGASLSAIPRLFQTYLLLLDDQIALMASKIADLTTQIEQANDELAHANVGSVIADIINALFKLSDSSEERDVQIAALLNIGIETLKSSFRQLWSNQQNLKELIKGLTTLKDNLSAIKTLFSALKNSLTGIISDTKSLLSLWSDVQARLGTVEAIDRNCTAQELQQIEDEWTKAQHAATEYIEAVTSSGATKAPSIQSLLKTIAVRSSTLVSKIPRTKAELRMAELIASLGPEARAATRARNASPLSSSNLRDANSDFLRVAGPPNDTQDILDELALQTSGVMKQFNDLLQIPYLNQLEVNDPDKPSQKIVIQDMVTNYQRLYWDLQQMTIPVAQDLQSYSNVVLVLLPMLVPSNNANDPTQITIDTYLQAHLTLAIQYKASADKIFNESLTYQNRWNNAMNAVIQAINECKTNIETWERTIDDLSEQVKQLTLQAVLLGIGALVIFAAAAFIPGGMLFTGALVSGGVSLLGMTIERIIQIGQLKAAINELKAQVGIAKDTAQKLETLLPYMQKIAASLTSITGVWSGISQNLNDVNTWNLLLSTSGASILANARPVLLNAWANIRDATQKYIDIITGQARSLPVYK